MKLLIIGASGYGNVGDDGYRVVFGEALGDKHELLFDSPHPDLRGVDWADAVIVGGGGVIYCNQTAHFDFMSLYLDRAIKQRKPVAFASCGVQLRPSEHGPDFVASGKRLLTPWIPYLEYASLITARSQMCLDIIRALTPDHPNAHWAPDACYAMPRAGYSLVLPDSTVFIPTPSTVKKKDFQDLWAQHKGKPRVYVAAFARDDQEVVRQLSLELEPHENYCGRWNLAPLDAMAVVQNAAKVITSRYHGYVFSRAAGLDESRIINLDKRYKALVEKPPQNPALEGARHMELLRGMLEDPSSWRTKPAASSNARPAAMVEGGVVSRVKESMRRRMYRLAILAKSRKFR